MDWSNIKIRCSAIGMLMTEPVEKEAKLRGELSKTAKNDLVEAYIRGKYDREKDITTKQMQKGIEQEQQGIDMLSKFYDRKMEKNQERFENDFICGHPDIIREDIGHIHDVKLSWDIWTFLDNVIQPLNKHYFGQLQGYMALTGAKTGEINYVLVDADQKFIEDEKRKLLYRMNVVTDLDPNYIEAAAGVEVNMIYPDIPLSEKILTFQVERDEDYIQQVYKKVEKARDFMRWFEEKHIYFNKTLTFEK